MITVSYEEARERIGSGDIIFICDSPTLTSKIIRFFTRSKYSHVGIAFWVMIGNRKRLMMVEAQGGSKRRIVNMSMYSSTTLNVVKAPRPWDYYADNALSQVGVEGYGWLEAIYVGLRESALSYWGWNLPIKDLPGEICSEFVAGLLELPNVNVSPQGLCDGLIEIGCDIKMEIKKPS